MGLTTAIIVLVAALVILALGAALLVVCRALSTAGTQLAAILDTIAKASEQAEPAAPAGPILASIKDELAAANKLLVPLLARKADAPAGAQRQAPRAALNGAEHPAPSDAATTDGAPPAGAHALRAAGTPPAAGQRPRADSHGSPSGEPGRGDPDR